MIITFSGQDGAGKTTALMRLLEKYKKLNIDTTVIYARAGNTPLAARYRSRIGKDASEKKVRRMLYLSAIELWYLWCVKLKCLNRRDRIVLCDRYTYDTEIDATLRDADFLKSRLWRHIAKCAPKPDLALFFKVDAEVAGERLNEKNEHEALEALNSAAREYEKRESHFDVIIDANRDAEEVWNATRSASESVLSRLSDTRNVARTKRRLIRSGIISADDKVKFERIYKGASFAAAYSLCVNGEKKYFLKLYATKTPAMKKIFEGEGCEGLDLPLLDFYAGRGSRCSVTRWIEANPVKPTLENAEKLAEALKTLHAMPLAVGARTVGLKIRILKFKLMNFLFGVRFPYQKELYRVLKGYKKREFTPSVVHMDMHLGNVLCDSAGKLHIIDFDNLAFGDPWHDFIYATVFHRSEEHEFWAKLLLTYFDGKVPDEFWQTTRYYAYVHALGMIFCEHRKRNYTQVKFIANSIAHSFDLERGCPNWVKDEKYGLYKMKD